MLSGQHITEALKRRRWDYNKDRRPPPAPYLFVSATILMPETPLELRQYYAGDVQNAQTTVQELTLPEFGKLLLDFEGKSTDAREKQRRMSVAMRKAGWDRTRRMVCPCRHRVRSGVGPSHGLGVSVPDKQRFSESEFF